MCIRDRQGTTGQSTHDYQVKIEDADKVYSDRARSLSQMLFGQLDQLGNKRLIVVPEGALQYVPFEALLAPNGSEARLLLETNEIIVEPSFSALIAIRNSIVRHASSPSRLVAVIADPVLNLND